MTFKNAFLGLLVVLTAGACSGGGGCGGCALEELPAGGVPSDQTIEGGAQLRISSAGFDTITQVLPAIVQDSFAGGTCVPEGGFSIVDYCYQNDGSCTNGCEVDLNIDNVSVSVPANDQLRLAVQFDVATVVPVEADLGFLGSPDCDIIATANNIAFDVIIGFDINAGSGELEINLERIDDININLGIDASDCGFIIDNVANLVSSIVNGLGSILNVGFIRNLLTPLLEPIIQGLLPDPLGIEAVANLGGLVGDVSPGTKATMEARIVPGGYVELERGGLSLGIITGINADEDLSTRTPDLDSEPALCVPPFAAPDFGSAPASLAQSSRQNFMLNAADTFRGIPESGRHVLIGASETMLDQVGHHMVSSGALCLQLGTALVAQLNLGTIGILVPSLAELGTAEGNDPLLLVTRPAKPIDFTIGDGTEESPSITMTLNEFSIDFYAFLFERYTRGFTVTLDLEIGINLEFGTDSLGNPTVVPILVGLDTDNIGVTILNEEFLREDKATLETVFPTLLDLVLPLVTGSLDSFALPEVAGFQLTDMGVERVTTSEDDFLSIGASLGAGSMMAMLSEQYPSVAVLAAQMAPRQGFPTSASARLVEVIAPSPQDMRAALFGTGGESPAVIVDLDSHDEMGRELEWTWNIEGGLWRPFVKGGIVTLEDGAFNLQGSYQLQFRARPVGDYKGWDPVVTPIEVVFDSVGPRILGELTERNAHALTVPSFDTVYERNVEVAFGVLGADKPSTQWGAGSLSLAQAEELAIDGEVLVFARDPQGNVSAEPVRISDATVESTETAGGCSTGGSTGWAGLLLVLLALGASRLRKQVPLLAVLLVGSISLTPACSCGSDPAGTSCVIDEDCLGVCPEGEVGQCFEEACRCLPEVKYGRIGQYSSMDVAPDGQVWVSGYNSTHGDLVVASTYEMGRIPNAAWQFVDGVPSEPVVLPPFSIRGGVKAEGEDVGLYTDIAVNDQGIAMVSYFDASTGSLKFAANYGGVWQVHLVDQGDLSSDDATAGKLAGQYSSISLDANGVPSIAYFAHVNIGTSEASTEVRYAVASGSEPRGGSDWAIELVDEAAVSPEDAQADVLTIPLGTGLFVELTRDNNDTPILAYYDRVNGDLKLAREAAGGGFDVETLAEGGDVGWYPSIDVDDAGIVHASYVDAVNQDLLYVNDDDRIVTVVDNGYRIVGTTEDGLPIPEFHFVGDDSTLILTADGVYIAYQDATTHELLIAYPNSAGEFSRIVIAGAEDPFIGAYGFFANGKYDGNNLTMSTWVVDQGNSDAWVELFKRAVTVE
tara:strand:- start:88338 stop:92201 length:3864 start_codon:yes stop_codon:yes gene_type:complete